MHASSQGLLDLLALEPIERNLFRGQNEPRGGVRLFGGQVLAQALAAASNTVEERLPHSLHGYFLRPGDGERPVLYEVERIRDGKSFTTRRVVAIQNGRAIFNMDVSFQVAEEGFDHEHAMPNARRPETLPDDVATARRRAEADGAAGSRARTERPFETRAVYRPGALRDDGEDYWNPVWIRFRQGVDELSPAMPYCLLAYASDMGMVATSAMPHAREVTRSAIRMASLDHALWFHRPFVISDWLLFSKRTSTATGARGMNHAEIFTRAGTLVASASQEGLMRVAR